MHTIERVTYNSRGKLDEVVVNGGAHLEAMDTNKWFLIMQRGDGSEFCIWIDGKITLTEERPARPRRKGGRNA